MISKKIGIGVVSILVVICLIVSSFYFDWFGVETDEMDNDVRELEAALHSKLGYSSINLEFDFSEPMFSEHRNRALVKVNESDFYSIGDGRPVIPVNITYFEFPFGTKIVDVDFEYTTPQIFEIDKILSYGSCSGLTETADDIYLSKNPYPLDFGTYHTGGGLSDDEHKTFLVVRVYPIRYYPLEDKIEFVDHVEVTIQYKTPENPVLKDETVYDLLIIAPNHFTKTLQKLVDHKNNMGVKTRLASLNEVYDKGWKGRDNQEKIKYYIKEAVESWGVKHVLLVGGIKRQSLTWNLPARYSHVLIPEGVQEIPEPEFLSDLYYADIYDSEGGFSSWDSNSNGVFGEWIDDVKDDMDLYPDVYIGRLPCRNIIEVYIMVNKIMKYEKTTYGKDWFDKLFLVVGDHWVDSQNLAEGELIAEEAIKILPGFDPVKIYASDGNINGKRVNDALKNGAGFAYFCGHGGVKAWSARIPPDGKQLCTGYNVGNMVFLRNLEKLPITVVGGCNNGQFDISVLKSLTKGLQKNGLKYFSPTGRFWYAGWVGNCWAWWLTSKHNGGTIATIANTGLGTHAVEDGDNNGVSDYIEVLDGWLELRFFELYGMEDKDILGENYGQAITDYLHRFLGDNDEMDTKMVQEWQLFGDPSLKIGGYRK
jgi:hypothetical protein